MRRHQGRVVEDPREARRKGARIGMGCGWHNATESRYTSRRNRMTAWGSFSMTISSIGGLVLLVVVAIC